MISRRDLGKVGAGAAAAGAAFMRSLMPQAEAQTPGNRGAGSAPGTMRAAQMTAFGRPLRVAEVPVAAPRRDGAVVQVEACGICRSDWHFWNHDWTWDNLNLPLPTVMGHEVGGVVVETGPDVRTLKVGDRVTIPFHEADGTCPQCRAGFQNLCDHVVVPAIHRTGGWAEYVTITAADLNCIPLPEGVSSLSAAALGCRYMTAYRGVVNRGQVQPGEWVAVQGCGGVGLSAVQIATAMGGLVVAVDIDDRKLEKARHEGAVVTINARGLTPAHVGHAVKDATSGGADVSVDALGRAFTAQQGLYALRKRGRHVQIGLTSQEEKGLVSIPLDDLVNNEWQMVGSLGNPHPQYPDLLAMVARKKLQPARLVTRQIGLADVTDTLQRMTHFDTVGFEVITRFG